MLQGVADTYEQMGRLNDAEDYYSQALSLFEQMELPQTEIVLKNLKQVRRRLNLEKK